MRQHYVIMHLASTFSCWPVFGNVLVLSSAVRYCLLNPASVGPDIRDDKCPGRLVGPPGRSTSRCGRPESLYVPARLTTMFLWTTSVTLQSDRRVSAGT